MKRMRAVKIGELEPHQFYTKGEEIFNSISHGVGALLSISALVLTVAVSYTHLTLPTILLV